MVGYIILGIVVLFFAIIIIRALAFHPKPQPQTDSSDICCLPAEAGAVQDRFLQRSFLRG